MMAMRKTGDRLKSWKESVSDALDSIRRAFAEFLTVPTRAPQASVRNRTRTTGNNLTPKAYRLRPILDGNDPNYREGMS